MKWYIYILIIVAVWCGLPASAFSQSGYEAFYFLRMPSSARANAIGGHTVSLIEQDPALAFHNPSLFGSETDGMISISYLNYISDINIGNAIYTKACGERAAWGAGISFIGYGSMLETSADNTVLGEFSAKDVAIDGFFAYRGTNQSIRRRAAKNAMGYPNGLLKTHGTCPFPVFGYRNVPEPVEIRLY